VSGCSASADPGAAHGAPATTPCSDRRPYGAIEWFGKIDRQLRALLNVQVAALYVAVLMDIRTRRREEGCLAEKLTGHLRYRDSPRYSERERRRSTSASGSPATTWTYRKSASQRLREHFTEPEVVGAHVQSSVQTFASKFAKAMRLKPQGFFFRSWVPPVRSPSMARLPNLLGAASVHQVTSTGAGSPFGDWELRAGQRS